jgi:two-component system, sensor histidine kinase and response regulator
MLERWGGKIISETKKSDANPGDNSAAEPAVDMDRMLDLTDGNHDSLRELVEMYLKQTHKQFGQMQEAVSSGNADSLRRVAHSCAGASATLGMTHLVPKLRDLEKIAGTGSVVGTAEILAKAAQDYAAVQEFLKLNPELASVFKNFNPA